MKVKVRKFSAGMTENDQASSLKKRRKDTSFWQKKKEVAASFITSTSRKCRLETSTTKSLCVVSLRPSATSPPAESDDALCLRRLQFSESSSLPEDKKEGDASFPGCAEIASEPEEAKNDEENTAAALLESKADLDGAPSTAAAPPHESKADLDGAPNTTAAPHESKAELDGASNTAAAAPHEPKADSDGAAAPRASVLDTIFSPVFQLFREDTTANCPSSVEEVETPDQRNDSIAATSSGEGNTSIESTITVESSPCAPVEDSTFPAVDAALYSSVVEEGATRAESCHFMSEETATASVGATTSSWDNGADDQEPLLSPGSIPIASPVDDIPECRFEPCLPLSPVGTHAVTVKSLVEKCVVTLVDVSGECIEWDLDDKIVEEKERHALDHAEGDGNALAADDTDLFLAVEQSKSLECNDEGSSEGEAAVEEEEEFEDIDPYLFIKRLPNLAEVVAPCRPLLLPRQTRRSPPITLVLDLDETLVHSTLDFCDDADFSFPVHFDFQEHMVYVRRRPHLQMFMERVAQLFEIIVFTASQSVYAEQLLNVLDPKRKLIRHRIFRDSCVFVRGNYLKDLTILGRDLSKVAIVDNSPQAYGFQVDNGIPIESWFDDRSDNALAGLLPFLETLVGVDDVRPVIAKRFNLRGKIDAAVEYAYMTSDPLDRFS